MDKPLICSYKRLHLNITMMQYNSVGKTMSITKAFLECGYCLLSRECLLCRYEYQCCHACVHLQSTIFSECFIFSLWVFEVSYCNIICFEGKQNANNSMMIIQLVFIHCLILCLHVCRKGHGREGSRPS